MTTESAFIETMRALASHPAARGLHDDCAVLEIGSEALVLTHDAMAEGIHFLAGQDPADVAWKLVATNLSDLAAKGAEPLGLLLGYQLGRDDARFALGLGEALEQFKVPLLGGDTIGRAGPQVLGLTALGRATHRPVPSRSGAKAGDGVWVTGALGAAMAGFEALQAGAGDSLAYRRPVPLIAAGQALASLITAMMDISDGLLLDCTRMAQASGVTIALNSQAIPIAVAEDRRDDALRWGDDYQLLFTLPPGAASPCPATAIGSVCAAGPHPLLLDNGPPTGRLGYEHGGISA